MLQTLLGNTRLKQELITALREGNLPHTVLLVGEPGSGTGYAARCLAADCLYPDGGDGAANVMEGNSPECMELEGSGASGQIPIGTIRDARDQMRRTALSAAGRVMILYQAENLNVSSANALLKILEEPPEGAQFILTVNSLASLLPTIRSRCCAYTVVPLERQECITALRQKGVPAAQAELLAEIYGGCLGNCLRAAQDEERLAALQRAQTMADCIAAGQEYDAQLMAYKLEKDRSAALVLLQDLTCLAAATLRHPGVTGMKPAQCAALIQGIDSARDKLARTGNLRLILMNLLAGMFPA